MVHRDYKPTTGEKLERGEALVTAVDSINNLYTRATNGVLALVETFSQQRGDNLQPVPQESTESFTHKIRLASKVLLSKIFNGSETAHAAISSEYTGGMDGDNPRLDHESAWDGRRPLDTDDQQILAADAGIPVGHQPDGGLD